MPKGLKLLNDFSGGLVNALHSRDIPANSLSVAENVQFSDSGSIKLIGEPYGELNLHSDLFLGGLKMIPFQEGHGIFHFKSDYCLSQKVRILAAFPNPDDGLGAAADVIRYYTSHQHGFKRGITVTLSGLHQDLVGHYEILKLNDAYSFDVSSTQ